MSGKLLQIAAACSARPGHIDRERLREVLAEESRQTEALAAFLATWRPPSGRVTAWRQPMVKQWGAVAQTARDADADAAAGAVRGGTATTYEIGDVFPALSACGSGFADGL